MKRYFSYGYWLFSVLTLFSCQPEDELLAPQSMMLEDIPMAEAVIESDGKVNYVGYGYNPQLGKSYKAAIAEDNIISAGGDFGSSPAFTAEIEIIDSYEKLDEFVNRSKKRSGGFSFFGFTLGGSKGRQLTEQMIVDDQHFSVVARVTSRNYRYEVDENLYNLDGSFALTPTAQALLSQGDANRFFGEYGTHYVSSITLGGEAYYVYNFDRTKLTEFTQKGSSGGVKFGFEYIFGINGESSGSKESYTFSEMSRAITSSSVFSSLAGFDPKIITTVDEFNEEKRRFTEKIESDPVRAATVSMSLRAYTSFVEDPDFQAEFDRRGECYRNYEQWQAMEDKLNFIYRNTTINQLRQEADQALNEVIGRISDAAFCNNAIDATGQYQRIMDWWELEQRTLPLYRYYSLERTNHYYSTDPESVKGIDGADSYQPEGIECRVFKEQGEGLTWLKEYWNNPYDDHRYESQLWMKGETQGYEYTRELGYIYENNTGLDESKIRQLYLYYNDEGKDHFMTTDPEGEFGSLAGGSGYRIMGTLGFAVSVE